MSDDSRFLTAQVCPNGHVVTSSLEWGNMDSKFCPDCGQATTTACECGASIRGHYHVPGVIGFGSNYSPPAYCYACGDAFSWTRLRLEAARELIEEAADLGEDEKAVLSGTLDDLLADGALDPALQRMPDLPPAGLPGHQWPPEFIERVRERVHSAVPARAVVTKNPVMAPIMNTSPWAKLMNRSTP